MKKLFAKYVISNFLNEGRPLTKFWRKLISSSRDLEEFEESAQRLDHLLRRPPGSQADQTPPALHSSIMQAVRRAEPAGRRQETTALSWAFAPLLRGTVASVLALILGAGIWLWLNGSAHWNHQGSWLSGPTQNEPALPARLPAFWTFLDEISTNGPALLVAPWSRQMGALSNDVRDAAQFILASVP